MITAPPIMDPRVNIVGVLYNAALAQYGAERLQAFVSNHESSMTDPHPKGQLLSRINQLFKSANGRASCRERVCTYVSITVVAVSLKKKIRNIQQVITQIKTKHIM